jgi:hypothetical protein
MVGVIRIAERQPLEGSRSGITWNDVQVNLSILILEECVVEVIWLTGFDKRQRSSTHLKSQIKPLVISERYHLLNGTIGPQEDFTQQILIAIEDNRPM